MNIFNLKRQVAGYMLMCGGGASGGGSSSNPGNPETGQGYSSGNTQSYDEGGMAVDNGDHNRFTGQEGESVQASTQTGYQSNGGEAMYGADSPSAQPEPAQTGISAGGDYSGYTTGSSENDNATPEYAKNMTEDEKSARFIAGKIPILGQLVSGVEQAGKFIQPGGSILKRGEVGGYGGSSSGGMGYLDENGDPIVKTKPTGMINKSMNDSAPDGAPDSDQQQQQKPQQQSYSAPQAATPAYAGGTVDATMYGSGSGWGASIAKFAKAKQGVQS